MARANPEKIEQYAPRSYSGPAQLDYVYYRGYSGNKTPNFQTFASQHRKIPPTPYSVEYQRYSSGRAFAVGQYPVPGSAPFSYTAWHWYRLTPMGLSSFDTDSDARSKAIGRLASQMNTLKLNVAQAFAERKQTVDMIASTALRIAKAASSLRKGRLGDAAKALNIKYDSALGVAVTRSSTKKRNVLGNYWLELQYGWKPLLQDIHGALELLASHITSDSYHHRVIARATAYDMHFLKYANDALWPYEDYANAGWSVCEHRGQYILDYRLESAARAALAATGVSNPALLAWELLPYSFVVDWFLPVGNYLEQLETFSGFQLVQGTYSSHKKVRYGANFNDTKKDFLGQGSMVKRSLSGEGTSGLFTRQVLTSFPTAALPSFKNPLSITHATNAIALVSSAFSSSLERAERRRFR